MLFDIEQSTAVYTITNAECTNVAKKNYKLHFLEFFFKTRNTHCRLTTQYNQQAIKKAIISNK